MGRRHTADRFLQPPSRPVARHRRADAARRGKSEPRRRAVRIARFAPRPRLQHEAARAPRPALAHPQEVGAFCQSAKRCVVFARRHGIARTVALGRESLAASRPTSCKDSEAAIGSFSSAETMPSFPHQYAWLICAFHAVSPCHRSWTAHKARNGPQCHSECARTTIEELRPLIRSGRFQVN